MADLDDCDLRSLITICNRFLREMTLPENSAGLIEHYRLLDELSSALSGCPQPCAGIYVRGGDLPDGVRSG